VVALAGCGGDAVRPPRPALPPDAVPIPAGPGPRYAPPALSARARAGRPVAGLACRAGARRRVGAFVEVIAHGFTVVVPAGVGIAPPVSRRGAFVEGGRCSYAARTRRPTGLIEVDAATPPPRLGQLFALWGQPLGRHRVAGFRAPRGETVRAYVGGHPWRGDPRDIRLTRHATIVLELASRIPPHRSYAFPPGF
jgi:hypothetical protein